METRDFAKLFETFKRSAFRLQTLSAYSIEDERGDFEGYMSGMPFPKGREGHEWLATIRRHVDAGRSFTNVHVLPSSLTDYLRYGIDWWYVYWAHAGADVRFILSESAKAIEKELTAGDFWVFDDDVFVKMNYGPKGDFFGPELVSGKLEVEQFRTCRDSAMRSSTSLQNVLSLRRHGHLC